MRAGRNSAAVALVGIVLSGCMSSDGPPIPPEGFTTSTARSGDPIVSMPVGTQSAAPSPALPATAPPASTPMPPASAPTAASFPASVARQAAPVMPASAEPAAPTLQPQPAVQTVASIRFTPVIGAPLDVIKPLSSELSVAARRRGIAIRTSSDASSDNILRGYFSALNDGSKTTVVYVWDVLDSAGNRLHRIQGEETVPGKPGDPWASVPASTMQTIANRTLDEYLAWHDAASG